MTTDTRSLRELIAAYWDCAYQEGVEGRTHDTPDGHAQAMSLAIEAAIVRLEQAAPSGALRPALVKAEAALSDIGDAEREPGDDIAWAEERAAAALPAVRAALATPPSDRVTIAASPTIAEVTQVLTILKEMGMGLITAMRVHGLIRASILADGQASPGDSASAAIPAPLDMVLHCPQCGLHHIDAPDPSNPGWTNPPHKSHLCQGCGAIWRPADVPTNGVEKLATRGDHDTCIVPRLERAIAWHAVCPVEDREIYPVEEWEFTTMDLSEAQEAAEAGYTVTPLGKIEAFPSAPVSQTLQHTAAQLAQCFRAWEPQVRVMGNVRAQDGLRLMLAILRAPGSEAVDNDATASRIERVLEDAGFSAAEAILWARRATADAGTVVGWQMASSEGAWKSCSAEEAEDLREHHSEVAVRGLVPWS